jgi:hypothetical protein
MSKELSVILEEVGKTGLTCFFITGAVYCLDKAFGHTINYGYLFLAMICLRYGITGLFNTMFGGIKS